MKHNSSVNAVNSGKLIIPVLAASPLSPVIGQFYQNSSNNNSYYYNGTSWVLIGGSLGGLNLLAPVSNANTNPNYPSAVSGDAFFIIDNPGKIGGASGKPVNIGDLVICQTTNIGGTEAAVGINWFIVQGANVYATETANGVVKLATQLEVGAGTNNLSVITPLKYVTDRNSNKCTNPTITGDNTTNIFVVNHTAGIDNICQVRDSTGNLIIVDILFGAATNTITFTLAPVTGIDYKVIIK